MIVEQDSGPIIGGGGGHVGHGLFVTLKDMKYREASRQPLPNRCFVPAFHSRMTFIVN